jgi:hypothetical protein
MLIGANQLILECNRIKFISIEIAMNIPNRTSELNPPSNITPSTGTVVSGILLLLPLFLLFIALYSGLINP